MEDSKPTPIRIEVTYRPESSSNEATSSRRLQSFGMFLDLIKTLAWPVLVLVIVIWLREPILSVARPLPEKVSAANEVTFASLSLKIERNTAAQGKPQLAAILKGLSSEAIEQLLKIGRFSSTGLLSTSRGRMPVEHSTPSDHDIEILSELERAHLIQVVQFMNNGSVQETNLTHFVKLARNMPSAKQVRVDHSSEWTFPDSSQAQPLADFQYRLTDSGRVALDSIIRSVAEQLSAESRAPIKTTTPQR